jgi:hypothetical protein
VAPVPPTDQLPAPPAAQDGLRRRPAERLQAWIVTGPLGHLWSVMVDVVVLWVRYGLFKLRTLAGAGRRPSARR